MGFELCPMFWKKDDKFCTRLVDLDGSINFSYKRVGCEKTDSSSQQPEGEDHQACVAEVQQNWHEFCDFQLGDEVKDGIGQHVHCGTTAHDEASPPPPVVLQN